MVNLGSKVPNFGEIDSSDRSFNSISSNLSSGVNSETERLNHPNKLPSKPVLGTKL